MSIPIKISSKRNARVSNGSPLMELCRICYKPAIFINNFSVIQNDISTELVILFKIILVLGTNDKGQVGQLFRRQDDIRAKLCSRPTGEFLCSSSIPWFTGFTNTAFINFTRRIFNVNIPTRRAIALAARTCNFINIIRNRTRCRCRTSQHHCRGYKTEQNKTA